MGGKRPDQHNIDPGEAGATNYQWRGEGRAQEEKIKSEEKRHERQTETEDIRRAMNPGETEGKRTASQEGKRSDGHKATPSTAQTQSEDERVDEASEESFPASDPPQQP